MWSKAVINRVIAVIIRLSGSLVKPEGLAILVIATVICETEACRPGWLA